MQQVITLTLNNGLITLIIHNEEVFYEYKDSIRDNLYVVLFVRRILLDTIT